MRLRLDPMDDCGEHVNKPSRYIKEDILGELTMSFSRSSVLHVL
jgi:hypothetical protein